MAENVNFTIYIYNTIGNYEIEKKSVCALIISSIINTLNSSTKL